jgi:hypothetical protein
MSHMEPILSVQASGTAARYGTTTVTGGTASSDPAAPGTAPETAPLPDARRLLTGKMFDARPAGPERASLPFIHPQEPEGAAGAPLRRDASPTRHSRNGQARRRACARARLRAATLRSLP